MGSYEDSLFLVDALRTEKVRGIGRGLCDFKWNVEDMSVEHGSGLGEFCLHLVGEGHVDRGKNEGRS